MTQDEITPILVSLGRLEEKIDSLLASSSDHETRIRLLEHGSTSLGAITKAGLALPGILSLILYAIMVFR